MIIGSIKENLSLEKRISITPEIAKKYINLGFQISVSKNYGSHLGFDDNQYKNLGVKIFNDEKDLINSLDIIVQLNLLSDDKILDTCSGLNLSSSSIDGKVLDNENKYIKIRYKFFFKIF